MLMESSTKKSGSVEIPKKKRSLDLKSLYEEHKVVKGGGESDKDKNKNKKKVSDENELVGDGVKKEKKKRKSRKELSLSSFEPGAKKSRKEKDVSSVKSELGSSKKTSDECKGSPGLQGISLGLDGSAFNFPKRPRGTVRRKKIAKDQVSEPLGQPEDVDSVDRVGAAEEKVIKTEDEGGLKESVTPLVTPSTGNDGISDSKAVVKSNGSNSKPVVKSNRSNSKPVGKSNGSNSKSKKKADSKSTVKSSSSKFKLKPKDGNVEVKETENGQSGSVHHDMEDCDLIINSGRTLSKKRRSNNKKKKDLYVDVDGGNCRTKKSEPLVDMDGGKCSSDKSEPLVDIDGGKCATKNSQPLVDIDVGNCSTKKSQPLVDIDSGKCSTKKSEPSVGSSVSDSLFTDSVDEDEDDEENLEQNAARMLSSRFDPSCTGFSSKRKSSVAQTDNGYSFQDSFNEKRNSLGVGESASADDRNRPLRPRREDKGKDLSRKRRHFYDILPRDLDAYWVLKRRIKIFWPLDETWYYGLVHDYHSETKHHHIKYDDRDEEWVDLREEKFKILLLPSEVPGKSRSRKQVTGDKDLHMGQTVPPAEDASSLGKDLDSVPIASWLASSSQRVKASKRRRTSQTDLSSVSSLPREETDNLNCIVADLKRTRNRPVSESSSNANLVICEARDESLPGTTSSSNNVARVVYVRKKYHKKSEGGSSECKPFMFVLPTNKEGKISGCFLDSNKQLWSIDDKGHLRFNYVLLESKEFRLQIHPPILPILKFSCADGHNGLIHDILWLQHGVVTTTSPAVMLEMLFIDSNLGLRFVLFEGFMKEAIAFVFLILIVFSQSDKHGNDNIKLPVTSIRFRLSSVQDLRKQHVFSFYSYSRLQASKQLYLDYKILQRCLLINQLSVSECTYDNIKKLECEGFQQRKPHVGSELSSIEGFQKNCLPGILPVGLSSQAWNTRPSGESEKVPEIALTSSAAAPFFQHLQLLMEHSSVSVSLQHQDAPCSLINSENAGQPVAECDQIEVSSVAVQDDLTKQEIGVLETKDTHCLPNSEQIEPSSVAVQDDLAKHETGVLETKDSHSMGLPNSEQIEPISVAVQDDETGVLETEDSHSMGLPNSEQDLPADVTLVSNVIEKAKSSPLTSITPPVSNFRSDTPSGGMTIVVPSFDQVDMPFDGRGCISKESSDVDVNIHNGFDHNTNSRSSSKRGRSSSIYSPIEQHSPGWSDGKLNFSPNGFNRGPKRPRTQVHYTLPFVGYDLNAKQEMQNQRSLPCKRIRRASLKNISDGTTRDNTKDNQKKTELQACIANVLITHGDKGWRECGAHIVLEGADHNEWRLAVKLSGVTKYSYKVKQILQPGSTNRYSHAMMWKGGKDWVLEFPDRSQWMVFKEMHEECHNRNIRAAAVKNIPIPGVKLIEESNEYGTEVPFVRNSLKYYRRAQTDVEMAMDHSHVLYDMDSDDEQWLMTTKSTDNHISKEISEDFLEKTIDMFEKASYVRDRDNFTDSEIEELTTGTGSMEAAKVVYEHWRRKRERKGMPLIRHLQPPLWERYQHQLKEWERTVSRGNCTFPVGSKEKVPPPEKPPMFAFCLKPRGLDVPNKGSKQRSHKKLSVSGHNHPPSGNHDSHLVFGRRSNGLVFGDERSLYTSSIHYSNDISPSLQASRSVLSPRDANFSLSNDASEWNRNPRNKPKKLGSYPSSQNRHMMLYNQRTIDNRQGVPQWNTSLPTLSNQRHHLIEAPHGQRLDQLDGSDLHEFRLRDASSAAKIARKMAKLKRERAKRLLCRADLAAHKAVVALMTAEAIRYSRGKSNGDN